MYLAAARRYRRRSVWPANDLDTIVFVKFPSDRCSSDIGFALQRAGHRACEFLRLHNNRPRIHLIAIVKIRRDENITDEDQSVEQAPSSREQASRLGEIPRIFKLICI